MGGDNCSTLISGHCNDLWEDGVRKPIVAQQAAVLRCLLRKRGSTVPLRGLAAELWPEASTADMDDLIGRIRNLVSRLGNVIGKDIIRTTKKAEGVEGGYWIDDVAVEWEPAPQPEDIEDSYPRLNAAFDC